MSRVFQLIVLISFPVFVIKKCIDTVNRFNVRQKRIDVPMLTKGEDPTLCKDVRERIESSFLEKRSYLYRTFSTIAGLLSLSWLLFISNLFFNIIEGYWVLLLAGLALIAAYFLHTMYVLDVDLIEARKDQNPDLVENAIQKRDLHRTSELKSLRVALVILLIVSGNWAFQNYRNDQNDRMAAIEELTQESGSGWCLNNDAKSDGAGGYYTFGGWPCITIGGISSISFSKNRNNYQICATVSFNRENGLPDYSEYLLNYKTEEFCAGKDYGSYDIFEMKSQMYEFVRPDLDVLQKDLCRVYSGRLYYEDAEKFCSYY